MNWNSSLSMPFSAKLLPLRLQGMPLRRLLPALLVLLGVTVLIGWVFRVRALTQIHAGLTSMVFNTALCFVAMGSALLLPRRATELPGHLRRDLAIAVLVLALLNVVQIATGASLGINEPAIVGWMQDGNPHPGRMSAATSVVFVLAGISLLMLGGKARPAPWRHWSVRLQVGLIALIGIFSTAGYALHLQPLYSWYAFSNVAPLTAVGHCTLAMALWIACDDRCGNLIATDQGRIIGFGAGMLVVVSLLTALGGFGLVSDAYEKSLQKDLLVIDQSRANLVGSTLELRSVRARVVATRPELLAQVRALADRPADPGAQAAVSNTLESFLPLGFRRLTLRRADGGILLAVGSPASAVEFEVPVRTTIPGSSALQWQPGFVLRTRQQLEDADGVMATLDSEQPLPNVDDTVMNLGDVGRSGDFRLCAVESAGLACFPSRLHAEAEHLTSNESADVARAIRDSDKGPVLAESPDTSIVVASGRVMNSGLVAVTQLDAAEFYDPIRGRLAWGGVLVAGFVAGAVLLLRRITRPLVRRVAEAEGRHRAVVEALQEGIMVLDPEFRLVSCNPTGRALLGMTEIDLRGISAFDSRWRVVREDGEPWEADHFPTVRTLRTGIPQADVLLGVYRPDGSLRWLNFSTAPVENVDGEGRRGVIASFTDVTDRRAAEALADQMQQRFRLLVDSVSDYAILMLSPNGKIVSWNRGAERIKGYSAEQILGQHFSLFYPAADQSAKKPEQELRVAADKGRFEEEGWRVRQDASLFWAHVTITAIRDGAGALVGYAKVTRDLTERRRSEQALAEIHRRLRSIVQCAPFSIVTVDRKGTIDCFNPAAERLTQFSADEMVGGSVATFHAPEEIAARASELSRELGRSVEPGMDVFTHLASRGVTEEREWTYIRKDGNRVPVHLAISALRDLDDSIVGYMGIAYDISERKRREEYTQHVAHHDYLTGLPMRSLLNDRVGVAMARARRDHSKIGVLMLDLDHFKRVNDSLGHHVGDELLKTVADRLRSCARVADTVARLGGDEFVVVLPDVRTLDDVERVARKIIDTVSADLEIGSHNLQVTPSIGIAMFPDDGETAQELLRGADTAMYRAKASGRHGFQVFTREMERVATERLELENALRRALERGELEVHYQPQVGLEEGQVIGMEALVRWNDPVRGPISPAQFIPVAEESTLILTLGEWVLRTACREARQLQVRTGRALRLAVNLSSHQFAQSNLLEIVRKALADSGLSPTDLELEITEGVLMDQTELAIQRLGEIRAMGITIAIDDFGTGFSSLAYVTRFPIDTLKIDRGFVSKVTESAGDAAVAQAIIALARSLEINVVAEGVETAAQLSFLRERCCDVGQGYLFGQAVATEKFSVQGFHFSAARSAAEFANCFDALKDLSKAQIQAIVH